MECKGRKKKNWFELIPTFKRRPENKLSYYKIKDHQVPLDGSFSPQYIGSLYIPVYASCIGTFDSQKQYEDYKKTLVKIQDVTGQEHRKISIKKECMGTLLSNLSHLNFDNEMSVSEFKVIQDMNNGGS